MRPRGTTAKLGRDSCGAVAWVALVLALLALASGCDAPTSLTDRPVEAPRDGYVTSNTCRVCHPTHYASWAGTYHRRMTQLATPDAFAADPDGVELHAPGIDYRFERRGDRIWLGIDRAGAGSEWHEVVLTTGSHNRQWAWFASGRGRLLGALPFIYLIDQHRWVPRVAAFMQPPVPDWKPSHNIGLWSANCISCHTTHGGLRTDERPSEVVEFGIACEACHGPGADHVRENRNPQRRYRYHLAEEPDPTIINPRRVSHQRSAQVCGQCHSISLMAARAAHRPDLLDARDSYVPGEDLAALARPAEGSPVDEYSRWSDGKMRSGGREYDALVRTPCFQRGEMSCLSCHTLHRTEDDPRPIEVWARGLVSPGMDGDRACLQCHETRPEHTHHAADSSGSRCYNCHMPYTNYALLKAIRNHGVEPPSAEATLATGRPNACNLCHLDRSLGWTADRLHEWYGTPRPELSEEQRSVAASVLWIVSGHAGQRALAAWHMGWPPAQQASGTAWLAPYLAQAMTDPYDAVRSMAYRSLRTLERFRDFPFDYVAPADERGRAAQRVIEIWSAEPVRVTAPPGAVLIEPDGRLRREAFLEILARRDERPVNWIE